MRNTEKLSEILKCYGDSDYYPFHMPGHKRNPAFVDFDPVVKMDITEIDGFDNMHRPEGIIKKAQQRAAALYGAGETHFLVNGSSAGIIAAVMGSCPRGGRILVARNCHKSVYHAIEMGGLKPVYIYPSMQKPLGIYGGIDETSVAAVLRAYTDIRAVVITSPTYEGVVSDIRSIAEMVHRYGIPLIVDEAHGAHFGFSKAFPQTAVRLGADIVIQSVHKTLPSLTQTALLHINGDIVQRAQVMKYYSYIQTTSPSYLMMASIDDCMSLLERDHENLFDKYRQRLTVFLEKCKAFKNICILNQGCFDKKQAYDFDLSKIVIYLEPVKACGKWLYDLLLNKYHLQMEMASRDYVLAMTSICDTEDGFERLYRALWEIDRMDIPQFPVCPVYSEEHLSQFGIQPVLTPEEAALKETEAVGFWDSVGRISAEYAYIYPPGIPFLVPGEKITQMHLEKMKNYAAAGFEIEGVRDDTLTHFSVLCRQ